MKSVLRFAALLLLVAAFPALAQRYAYVANPGQNVVAVFDTQTGTFTGTNIPVGSGPWSVEAHPNGTRVYVPNSNSNTVSVISTATNAVVATVTVGANPFHAEVSPDGSEVWVPNYSAGNVSVISTATNTVVATINGIPSANGIVFSPDASRVYVSSWGGNAIYAISTATRAVVQTYTTVGASSESLAISRDGRSIYVASTNTTALKVLNTSTGIVTTMPQSLTGGSWGVAANPNGRYWYVAYGARFLNIYRTADNSLVTTLNLSTATESRTPTGISIDPTGTFAYVVGRTGTPSMIVVNLVTNTVANRVTTAGTPYGMGHMLARPLNGDGSIAAGQYFTCRIRTDFSADCWGRNDYGQATAPAGSFLQLTAGSAHTCGLKTDSTVVCWGNNSYGQTTVPATVSPFQQISAGARNTCGLRANGTILCWGENDQGHSTAPSGASDNNFQQVSAGSSHACGLRSTGLITCWGRNAEGQTTVPALPGGVTYTQVVTGGGFSCGLRSNRSTICWGDNTNGKATAPATLFAKIFAQSSYACGTALDGTLSCWGDDNYGEIANRASGSIAAFGQGRSHGCALRALGVATCWGWNLYNQAPQFDLNPLTVDNASVNQAFIAQKFTMAVSNAGDRYPYAPRASAYVVIAGSLPTGMSLSAAGELSGTPTSVGPYNFTVQGQDANGFVATRAYTLNVSGTDPSAPVVTPVVTGTAGLNGWYRSDVTVTWTTTDPQSQISSETGCGPTTLTAETAGTVLTCSATSLGGTTSVQYTVKIDKTAPVLTPVLSNTRPLLGETITGTAGGVDPLSGVVSDDCGTLDTNVVSVDAVRVTCTATDAAGNTASKVTTYRVVYGFSGFTGAVYNPGWTNQAGLNQDISFVYQVTDFDGNGVTGLSAPTFSSAAMACPASVKSVVPPASSGPGFVERTDLGDGWYELVWTSPAVASCARLTLNLGDGDHVKRVQFKFQ